MPRSVTGPRRAVVRLASRDSGVVARSSGSGVAQPSGELVSILSDAARWFTDRSATSWVPSYLTGRGFDAATFERRGVGYAPGEWTALTDHLRGRGFGDMSIETSGLAKRSSRGTLIDVFRDRAVFPIRTASGTVIGFHRASPTRLPR
jgi:DNA primase